MTSKLVATVVDGLNKAKGDWDGIAKEAEVSYFTISKMVSGAVANPTATRLERIYMALVRRGHLKSTFEFRDCA